MRSDRHSPRSGARAFPPRSRPGNAGNRLPRRRRLIKSDASLNRALRRVEYAKEAIAPRLAAKDPRDLAKLYEAKSMLQAAELFVRSSLMRTETRAGHYREDYPDRNNEEWLGWIYAKKGADGAPMLHKVPVPLERYGQAVPLLHGTTSPSPVSLPNPAGASGSGAPRSTRRGCYA